MATDTNAYALGVGCLLATMRHRGVTFLLPRRTAEIGVGSLILFSLVPYTDLGHLYSIGVSLPVISAAVSGLVIWASLAQAPGFLSGRVLVWFGGISYALYLWHAPLLLFPMFTGAWGNVAALAISIGVASLSWHLIERPISGSRLRRRLTPGDRVPSMTPERVG